MRLQAIEDVGKLRRVAMPMAVTVCASVYHLVGQWQGEPDAIAIIVNEASVGKDTTQRTYILHEVSGTAHAVRADELKHSRTRHVTEQRQPAWARRP